MFWEHARPRLVQRSPASCRKCVLRPAQRICNGLCPPLLLKQTHPRDPSCSGPNLHKDWAQLPHLTLAAQPESPLSPPVSPLSKPPHYLPSLLIISQLFSNAVPTHSNFGPAFTENSKLQPVLSICACFASRSCLHKEQSRPQSRMCTAR